VSNYVTRTSNQLANAILDTSNDISKKVHNLDVNMSNYVTKVASNIMLQNLSPWISTDDHITYNQIKVYKDKIKVNVSSNINYWCHYEFNDVNTLQLDSSVNNRFLNNNGGTYQYIDDKNSIVYTTYNDGYIDYFKWNDLNDFTISSWFNTYQFKDGDILFNFSYNSNLIYSSGLTDGATGFTTNKNNPVKLNQLNNANIIDISANTTTSLFLADNGYVYACGKNDNYTNLDDIYESGVFINKGLGKLGIGSNFSKIYDPILISTSNISKICAGYAHSMFLGKNNLVYGCGDNSFGQLGQLPQSNVIIPTIIPNVSNIISISSKVGHTLLLTDTNTVYSFGENENGQLGYATQSHTNYIPTLIPNFSNIIQVNCSFNSSYFLKADGTVYSCGINHYGELGLNVPINQIVTIPTCIPYILDIKQISAEAVHSLFLNKKGLVYSCGLNDCGQLGLGDQINRSIPTLISNISNIIKVSTSRYNSHFINNNNNIYVCGYSYYGIGGITSGVQFIKSPILLSLNNIKSVSCDAYHSLFLESTETNNNIKLYKKNDSLSFQINNSIIYETPYYLNNYWNHIIWNIKNSISSNSFIKINNNKEFVYASAVITSNFYFNKIGSAKNSGKLYINCFRILDIPITETVEKILESKTLINDIYLANSANKIFDHIWQTSNILINYIKTNPGFNGDYNSLTNKLTAGTGITISNNTINTRLNTLATQNKGNYITVDANGYLIPSFEPLIIPKNTLLLNTIIIGALEFDGKVPYFSTSNFYRGIIPCNIYNTLYTSRTINNNNTAQPIFTNNIILMESTAYEMEMMIYKTRSYTSGTAAAHNIGLSFTGTATLTTIGYSATYIRTTGTGSGPFYLTTPITSWITTTINRIINNTTITLTTTNTEYIHITIKGLVRVATAGTFVPSITYSAVPVGGTVSGYTDTLVANSYIKLTPIGVNTGATFGDKFV
jgi:alpha-tubulin suppressor-like RCC1 family protein